MRKPFTTSEFIEKSKLIHNNYDYSKVHYINAHTKIEIICPKHNSFFQTPEKHLRGRGCHQCGKEKNVNATRQQRTTIKDFTKKSNKIHNNKFDYSKSIYTNSQTKIIIICPIHGEFQQTPNHHLQGNGCCKCEYERKGKLKRVNFEKIKEKSKLIHNNKYEYINIIYKNGSNRILIKCPHHGIFKQHSHIHLKGQGCNKCGIESRKYTTEEFTNKSNIIHNNLYDYSKSIYKNCYQKIIIICSEHGEFLQNPRCHISGQGCPKCVHTVSKPQTKFLDYINIKNQNVVLEKWKKKRVDGYDEKTNTVYEFLGDYFHGNPEKYKSQEYNQICHKTFGELYENTFKIMNKVKSFGYNVKYIWENDWKQFKNGIDTEPKIQSLL